MLEEFVYALLKEGSSIPTPGVFLDWLDEQHRYYELPYIYTNKEDVPWSKPEKINVPWNIVLRILVGQEDFNPLRLTDLGPYPSIHWTDDLFSIENPENFKLTLWSDGRLSYYPDQDRIAWTKTPQEPPNEADIPGLGEQMAQALENVEKSWERIPENLVTQFDFYGESDQTELYHYLNTPDFFKWMTVYFVYWQLHGYFVWGLEDINHADFIWGLT